VRRRLQRVVAHHPAFELRRAAAGGSRLACQIGRVGIATLAFVDVGEQRQRGAAILDAGTRERLGLGLCADDIAGREPRARVVEPGVELRGCQGFRPARPIAACRSARQEIGGLGEARLP